MLLEQLTVLITCKRVVSWPGNGYDKIHFEKYNIPPSSNQWLDKNWKFQLSYTMKILRQKSFAVFYMFIKLLYMKVQDDTVQILLTCKVVGFQERVFAKVCVYSLPQNFYGIQYYIAVCFVIINTNLMCSNYSKMGSV